MTKKFTRFSIACVLGLAFLLLGIDSSDAQTLKFLDNPASYQTYGYQGSPIAFGDTMFLRFRTDTGNYVLAKHHASIGLKFIESPAGFDADGAGYIGSPIKLNDTLYLRYRNNSQNFQLVKYHAGTLTAVANPTGYENAERGIIGLPIEYKGAVYYRVQNNSRNFELAKYDGSGFTYYTSPANFNTGIDRGYFSNPVVANDTLFMRYKSTLGTFGNYALVKFDGSALSVIPNSIGYNGDNRGHLGEGMVHGGKLYFRYQNNTGANVLARYENNEISTINSPNNYNNSGRGYMGSPISFGGNLYLRYQHNDGYSNLVRYTGTLMQIIQNPSYMDVAGYGYQGDPQIVGGNMFLTYSGENLFAEYQIVQFDGTTLYFKSNPSGYTTYGYRGSPFLYQGKFYLRMLNDMGYFDVVRYDLTNFNPYLSPAEFAATDKGYQGNPSAAGSYLYMQYLTATNVGKVGYFDVCVGPEISLEPGSKSTCETFNTFFSFISNNTTGYQWQDSVSNGSWTNLANAGVYSGVDKPRLDITGVPLSLNGRYYRCIASGSCTFNDTTTVVQLTVNAAPTASVISGDTTVCSGSSGAFKVQVTGGASPYRVTYTGAGLGNVVVNPYTSGNLIPVTTAADKTYTLVSVRDANNCIGTGLSGSAIVRVSPPVNVATSVSGSVISATETAAASYTWLDCNNANQSVGAPSLSSFSPSASGDYAVIISKGACADTSACVNVLLTAIEDDLEGASVFMPVPNPSAGNFVIHTGGDEAYNVTITDLSGRTAYSAVGVRSGAEMNLSGLQNGTYIIKGVSAAGKVKYGKAVISK